MNKSTIFYTMAVIMIIIPIIFLAFTFNDLPASVPLHFGIDGKPDRFGNKSELLISLVILTLVNAAVFLLLTNLHKIDPKKSAKTSQGTIRKIAIAVVCLLSFISIMIVYAARNTEMELPKLLLPALGIFFTFLGNLMYSVKPNYFVGIRTPWALEDEDNWRKTHQLAGKLWFGGGLLITILALALPVKWGFIALMIIIFIMTVIPFVFSYRYFKNPKTT